MWVSGISLPVIKLPSFWQHLFSTNSHLHGPYFNWSIGSLKFPTRTFFKNSLLLRYLMATNVTSPLTQLVGFYLCSWWSLLKDIDDVMSIETLLGIKFCLWECFIFVNNIKITEMNSMNVQKDTNYKTTTTKPSYVGFLRGWSGRVNSG